jgi:hypothetical protein
VEFPILTAVAFAGQTGVAAKRRSDTRNYNVF